MTENNHAVKPRIVYVGMNPAHKERLFRAQGRPVQGGVPDYFSDLSDAVKQHSAQVEVEKPAQDTDFLDQLGALIRNVNKQDHPPLFSRTSFAAHSERLARDSSLAVHPSNVKLPPAAAPKKVTMHVDEVLAARTIAATNERGFLRKHAHVEAEVIRIGLAMNPNCDRDILEALAANEGLSSTIASVRLKDLDHAEAGLRNSISAPELVNDTHRWMDATGITVVRHLTGDLDLVKATVGECLELVRKVVEGEVSTAEPAFEPKLRFTVVEVAPDEFEVHAPLSLLTVVDPSQTTVAVWPVGPGMEEITRMYKGDTYFQSEDVATIDGEKLIYRATDCGLASLARNTDAVLNGIVIDGDFWEKVNPIHSI